MLEQSIQEAAKRVKQCVDQITRRKTAQDFPLRFVISVKGEVSPGKVAALAGWSLTCFTRVEQEIPIQPQEYTPGGIAMSESKPGASQYSFKKIAIAPFVALLLLSGCNIFEPFHAPGSGENPEDLLYDVQRAMNDGDYERALVIADRAIAIAPEHPRVRYVHAVVVVRANGVDMLDILEILEPGEDNLPVGGSNERVLAESEEDLKNLFDTFRVVSADLQPLVAEIAATGRELRKLNETDDVFLSYGVSETILGMLRVIDNDDSETEFSTDERIVLAKSPDSYDIDIDDVLMTPQEVDDLIDTAIERSWNHFVNGRFAFFLYYQYVLNEMVWTSGINDPPDAYPETIDTDTSIGEILKFVDDNAKALFDEKEDIGGIL
jgi:hypothetical protein